MSKSLLEQLPGIVAAGKRQAAQILEQLEGRNRVNLQTRELVTRRRIALASTYGVMMAATALGSPTASSTVTTCWQWLRSWRGTRILPACEARLI